jgi:colanic acid/amylovoran biosynthesis glycosyltransferase
MQSPAGQSAPKQPLLVIVPSITAARKGNLLFLDEKAVSGLRLYSNYWPGSVRAIFREGSAAAIPFGGWHQKALLPFDVAIIPKTAPVTDALLHDAKAILGSGDNHLDFPLVTQCRTLAIPLIFVIEYTLETRLKIIALSETPPLKRLKSMVWAIRTEIYRRRAFVRAAGLQANGIPATESFAKTNRKILTYFDTRLSEAQFATDQEIAVKVARIMSGAPLRLAFTGRLEKMKGADDLIRIAFALKQTGLDFHLDIYGAGSLESDMRAALNCSSAVASLHKMVRIHQPVNFDHELVPMMRSEIDVFLCCHRQSDPSSTYLETLGCGVPIMGYNNRAWRGILNLADVGWATPMGAPNLLVRKIVDVDANRQNIVDKMWNALNFARQHSFEIEFNRRINHLLDISNEQKHNT